ncbi:ankyrin repeat domain-containing protein [Streptomyces sp. NPDC001941]|uniref:ankyrin repeat domain-containing protein n=1 Tax=Streptomyces sp. NPDC001941 TaxID=3154659 RepID=UPI00331C12D1
MTTRRRRKKLDHRLYGAVLGGSVPAVRAALRAGADPHGPYADGTTPLYQAAVQGNGGVVRLLLELGAAPDTESHGLGAEGTPLCAAACWGHESAVRALLSHGADPNLPEDAGTGLTPLQWAARGPHDGTVELLVAAGAVDAAG